MDSVPKEPEDAHVPKQAELDHVPNEPEDACVPKQAEMILSLIRYSEVLSPGR